MEFLVYRCLNWLFDLTNEAMFSPVSMCWFVSRIAKKHHILSFLPDISMANCEQTGWKRDAGDPSIQLQQSLLQQVRYTAAASLS